MDSLETIARRYYDDADPARKSPHYYPLYERFLDAIHDKPLRILELGVYNGKSMWLWRDYFPRAQIVGFDILPRPANLPDDPRMHFVQGDQGNLNDLALAAKLVEGRQFDVIIDDASHMGDLTRRSFHYLFPNCLVPGGLYVIEDYVAPMLKDWPDGHPYSPPAPSNDPKIFPSYQYGAVGFVK